MQVRRSNGGAGAPQERQPTRQPLSCAGAQPSRPHLRSGTRACRLCWGSPAAGLAPLPLPPAARPSRSRRSQSRRGSRRRCDQTPGSGEGGHTQFLTAKCTVGRPCWSWPCHAVWRQEAFACPGKHSRMQATPTQALRSTAAQHSTAPHSTAHLHQQRAARVTVAQLGHRGFEGAPGGVQVVVDHLGVVVGWRVEAFCK